jgi:hypothetical protein
MWVPMPRWMPEQRMQTKTPMFQLAHLGSDEHQHSAKIWYGGMISYVCSFYSLRRLYCPQASVGSLSSAGFLRRDQCQRDET